MRVSYLLFTCVNVTLFIMLSLWTNKDEYKMASGLDVVIEVIIFGKMVFNVSAMRSSVNNHNIFSHHHNEEATSIVVLCYFAGH